jgi:hypothetical protein
MRIVVAMLVWAAAAGALVRGQDGRSGGGQAAAGDHSLVRRFLSSGGAALVSYRAVRHLEASARAGRMRASLSALTSFDAEGGFRYEILSESGSSVIRAKVLRAALAAEQHASQRAEAGRAALTEVNYEFTSAGADADGLARVGLQPRRDDAMLIKGAVVLDPESADLLRLEGTLIKRPSFWTRGVHVTRTYARLLGVRVPVSMESRAEVLIVGSSFFSMTYDYSSINGVEIDGHRAGR